MIKVPWKRPFKIKFMKKKCSLSGARTHESDGSIEFPPIIWIFKKIRLNLGS